MKRSIVYRSRFTPDVDGAEIDFEVGEIALLYPTCGTDFAKAQGKRIIILSGHTYNSHTPEGEFWREIIFESETDQLAFGFEIGQRFLVCESVLRPINQQQFNEGWIK